ncbi:MAG: VWA domain-containing protein [Planctomycetales bacterium]|nr:VWA domain-containing protein [Planctomycetales bacterium]
MRRSEHPQDRQLRAIPDRPGLLRRLREAVVADEALDDWLRDVTTPHELESRLLATVADVTLDEQLQDVAIPETFESRLLAAALDAAVDDELVALEAPAGLESRLREIAIGNESLDTWLRDVAAPVASVTSASAAEPERVVVTSDARRGAGRQGFRGNRRWSNWAYGSVLALTCVLVNALGIYGIARLLNPSTRPGNAPLLVSDWGALRVEGGADAFVSPLSEMELPEWAAPPRPAASEIVLQDWDLPEPGVFHQLARELSSGLDLGMDLWASRVEHLGYRSDETEEIPAMLERVSPASASAPPLPRHRGYDRAFHWRYGVSPWVNPAALPRQAMSLEANPAAFERVLADLGRRRSVAPLDVRVEDALATLDPRYPLPAPGELGLRTSAGPSVFGELDSGMLQIGVAAGAPRERLLSPVRLTVLLDLSDAVNAAQRAEAIRQLMTGLRLLEERDQVTIVTIGSEPQVLCDSATRDELESIRRTLHDHLPGGIADWGRALPRAVRCALEGRRSGVRQHLLIASSGHGEWADSAERWMDEALSAAGEAGVAVSACGLSNRAGTVPASSPEEKVRAWLLDGSSPVTWRHGPQALRASVVGALVGGAGPVMPVAQRVRLSVEFNPQVVAAYRVVGQDATAGQWMDGGSPVSLWSGEQTTALIELRFRPSDRAGAGDDVGRAELQWLDAEGASRELRQRVSRLQFAPSFQQATADLQQSVLAAEAAQILRESPFARGRGHEVSQLGELLWECSEEVRMRPAIERLMSALVSSRAAENP